ncbi:hypothetical protein V1512DRAFT_258101 [Lipomyces arxii]|uniref:uncharacterized protein n=1 Tax=Lipomyces arxii TaxID=56418 RepID=UPI0034CECBBF
MIPFEALLPYGVIIIMFGVAGTGMSAAKVLAQGNGKQPRVNRDHWDRRMMERDMRLTKAFRAQSDTAVAPEEFKISSVWRATKALKG